MLRKAFLAAAAALGFLSAGPAAAAVTLQVNGSGQLTGANGVNIGGTIYDVAFADGTCGTVFGACDLAHLDFTTVLSADLAAQALLDQVLTGAFDTNPNLTLGCGDPQYCFIAIPYGFDSGGYLQGSVALNVGPTSQFYSQDGVAGFGSILAFNTATAPNYTFANFTATGLVPAAVPEPATWAMMLLGFGGIGMAMRRKRTALSAPFA